MDNSPFKSLPKSVKAPEFFIGVDAYDENNLAYCLCWKIDNHTSIVLCNTRNNKKDFDEEVHNLSKYFNAKIIEEK